MPRGDFSSDKRLELSSSDALSALTPHFSCNRADDFADDFATLLQPFTRTRVISLHNE
jgi:hypothetical protein